MYIMTNAFMKFDGLYMTSIAETLYLASFCLGFLSKIVIIDVIMFLRTVLLLQP